MDAETLTFPDAAFDWAIARDGLHHLARPLKGLYELERVCREGFVILEGQDSLPVRLLARLGVAENWDPAGGYVYRFQRREMKKIFSSLQTVSEYKVHTAWLPFGSDVVGHFPPFRRFLYPVLKQPLIERVLSTKPVRRGFRTGFDLWTLVAGRWGNSLIVVARKAPS